ncbi:MAG: hypothetical protein AAGC55_32425, partial [Myxococcota bacterium]
MKRITTRIARSSITAAPLSPARRIGLPALLIAIALAAVASCQPSDHIDPEDESTGTAPDPAVLY